MLKLLNHLDYTWGIKNEVEFLTYFPSKLVDSCPIIF